MLTCPPGREDVRGPDSLPAGSVVGGDLLARTVGVDATPVNRDTAGSEDVHTHVLEPAPATAREVDRVDVREEVTKVDDAADDDGGGGGRAESATAGEFVTPGLGKLGHVGRGNGGGKGGTAAGGVVVGVCPIGAGGGGAGGSAAPAAGGVCRARVIAIALAATAGEEHQHCYCHHENPDPYHHSPDRPHRGLPTPDRPRRGLPTPNRPRRRLQRRA